MRSLFIIFVASVVAGTSCYASTHVFAPSGYSITGECTNVSGYISINPPLVHGETFYAASYLKWDGYRSQMAFKTDPQSGDPQTGGRGAMCAMKTEDVEERAHESR